MVNFDLSARLTTESKLNLYLRFAPLPELRSYPCETPTKELMKFAIINSFDYTGGPREIELGILILLLISWHFLKSCSLRCKITWESCPLQKLPCENLCLIELGPITQYSGPSNKRKSNRQLTRGIRFLESFLREFDTRFK